MIVVFFMAAFPFQRKSEDANYSALFWLSLYSCLFDVIKGHWEWELSKVTIAELSFPLLGTWTISGNLLKNINSFPFSKTRIS